MVEIFIRTFLMVMLMEIGSSSNFMIAVMASHTKHQWVVGLAGLMAMILTCSLALFVGNLLQRLPFSPNLIAGTIMVLMGMILLWKP